MEKLTTESNKAALDHITSRLDVLIEHFGEEITLRELRVRMKLFQKFVHEPDAEVSYSEIAGETGVNQTTLGRYLLQCLVEQCLNERIDPADRRRRLISLAPSGADRMNDFLTACRETPPVRLLREGSSEKP